MQAVSLFDSALTQCEDCIGKLMGEQAAQCITNHESLLEKMFGYQE